MSFTASAPTPNYLDAIELRWTTTGATSCSIDQTIGIVAAQGPRPLTVETLPNATITYRLSCTGAAPGTATADVTLDVQEVAFVGDVFILRAGV